MVFFASFSASIKKSYRKYFLVSIFFMGFLYAPYGGVTPAYADDDPFQFESTHWMSFERYKEKTKHGAPATDAADAGAADDSVSTTVPTLGDAHNAAGESTTVTPPTMTPTVAAPTRAIHIPVMPGMNKGYNLRVNSTEDEKTPVAQITHMDTQPTISIPEQNWQTPKEAAQLAGKDSDSDSDEHQPLNVRMSFLPNTYITPVPSPEYKSTHGRKPPTAVVAAAPEEPKKKASDLAACAAVDAYKKKQLEAIESDRQTLTALQSAISQLGLQKELSFMTGANGGVNQADSGITGKMDMPPSLAAPAKN
jgi:hypothetical protein